MNNTAMVYSPDGWQSLGMAVIKQAADDWRTAHRRLKFPLANEKTETGMIRECERFLRSKLPNIYCDVDGNYILKKLKEELENGSSSKTESCRKH